MPVTATASDHLVGVPGSAQPIHAALDDDLLYVIAAAEDFRAGIAEVFTRLRRTRAVAGAEWWTPAADGSSLRLELSAGSAAGVRTPIPIGAAGTLVLVGESAAASNRRSPVSVRSCSSAGRWNGLRSTSPTRSQERGARGLCGTRRARRAVIARCPP